jgi:hypothetical protein
MFNDNILLPCKEEKIMHNETHEEMLEYYEDIEPAKAAQMYIEDITAAVDAYVEFAMRIRMKEIEKEESKIIV